MNFIKKDTYKKINSKSLNKIKNIFKINNKNKIIKKGTFDLFNFIIKKYL